MTRAERHLWIDADVVVPLWHIFVEGGSNDAARMLSDITDDERLKIVFLPLLVPILVFRFRLLVGDLHVWNGEICQDSCECIGIEEVGLDVGFESVFVSFFSKNCRLREIIVDGNAG